MKRKFGWLTVVALVATTTVALAGRSKFTNSNIYADVNGTKQLVATSGSMPGLTTSVGSNQAKIVSSGIGTPSYNLYTHDGSDYVAVYSNGF